MRNWIVLVARVLVVISAMLMGEANAIKNKHSKNARAQSQQNRVSNTVISVDDNTTNLATAYLSGFTIAAHQTIEWNCSSASIVNGSITFADSTSVLKLGADLYLGPTAGFVMNSDVNIDAQGYTIYLGSDVTIDNVDNVINIWSPLVFDGQGEYTLTCNLGGDGYFYGNASRAATNIILQNVTLGVGKGLNSGSYDDWGLFADFDTITLNNVTILPLGDNINLLCDEGEQKLTIQGLVQINLLNGADSKQIDLGEYDPLAVTIESGAELKIDAGITCYSSIDNPGTLTNSGTLTNNGLIALTVGSTVGMTSIANGSFVNDFNANLGFVGSGLVVPCLTDKQTIGSVNDTVLSADCSNGFVVAGYVTMKGNVSIVADGQALILPEATLIINTNKTLTNSGTLTNDGLIALTVGSTVGTTSIAQGGFANYSNAAFAFGGSGVVVPYLADSQSIGSVSDTVLSADCSNGFLVAGDVTMNGDVSIAIGGQALILPKASLTINAHNNLKNSGILTNLGTLINSGIVTNAHVFFNNAELVNNGTISNNSLGMSLEPMQIFGAPGQIQTGTFAPSYVVDPVVTPQYEKLSLRQWAAWQPKEPAKFYNKGLLLNNGTLSNNDELYSLSSQVSIMNVGTIDLAPQSYTLLEHGVMVVCHGAYVTVRTGAVLDIQGGSYIPMQDKAAILVLDGCDVYAGSGTLITGGTVVFNNTVGLHNRDFKAKTANTNRKDGIIFGDGSSPANLVYNNNATVLFDGVVTVDNDSE